MKKTVRILCAAGVTGLLLTAFRIEQTSGIKGSIMPAEAVVSNIFAINGTDTVSAQVIKGSFVISAKTGTWKVIVDAREPYKDAVIESVQVKEAQITDIGEIKLSK